MPSFDDLKKTLEQGVSIAKEGVAYAAERAEDLSLAAALRLRIFGLRRRIERHYAELGAAVYYLLDKKEDVRADASVKKHVKNIAALQAEINGLFAQLAEVSRKSPLGPTRRPEAKRKKPGPRGPRPRGRKGG